MNPTNYKEQQDKKKKKKKKAAKIKLLIRINMFFSWFMGIFGALLPIFLSMFIIIFSAGAFITLFDVVGEKAQDVMPAISNRLGLDLSNNNVQDIISDSILKPMNKDITDCEYCVNCKENDRYFELITIDGITQNNRINATARLNKQEGEGAESYKNMDWIYSGWTIDDSDYWDVDFSKFSTRLQDKEGEFLFNHKVNNLAKLYENDINKGRCTFTYEFKNGYPNGNFSYKLDEDSRNGTFIKTTDGTSEWLDFGNYRFKTYDGRILSAFAPMVTEGEKAVKSMVKAKSYFHDSKYWKGKEESFTNGKDSLWDNVAGNGAYIDVVFEDNNSGTQVVIPFIYADAKNLHWFNSMGGRADQRYGQVRGTIQQMHSNGQYTIKKNLTSGKLTYLCDFSTDVNYYLNNIYTQGILSVSDLNKYTDKIYLEKDLIEGKIIENLDLNSEVNNKIITESIFKGKDKKGNDCFLYLDNLETTETSNSDYSYGDDDFVNYDYFTPLELIQIQYNTDMDYTSPAQSWANLMSQTLLNGFIWAPDNINNTRPDWSLVAMRVYYQRKANLSIPPKDDTYFTELSKTFEEVDDIEGNKVITFETDPNCNCTFCARIAR